jgi:hypothetical protein
MTMSRRACVVLALAACTGGNATSVRLTIEADPELEIERAGLTRGQRQALQIDDSAFRIHSRRG